MTRARPLLLTLLSLFVAAFTAPGCSTGGEAGPDKEVADVAADAADVVDEGWPAEVPDNAEPVTDEGRPAEVSDSAEPVTDEGSAADAAEDIGVDTPEAPQDWSFLPPRRTLSEGFHEPLLPPAAGEPFSLIVASDPQLWWNSIDDENDISDEQVEAQNRLHISAMNALIGGEGLPEGFPAPTAVVMNGDLTEYGRWAQWDAYYRLYEEVAAPIFDGLGNHEYENNNSYVSNGCAVQLEDIEQWFAACKAGAEVTLWGAPACEVYQSMGKELWGWCASDAMRRTRHWLRTHREYLRSVDEGSAAYSWELGDLHFVQLHNYPSYEVPKTRICSAIPWLKQDLKDAFERGKRIVLNLHQPITRSMKQHLEGFEYNVVGIFYGHYHDRAGHTGSFRVGEVDIPKFHAGSVQWNIFSLARFGPDSLTVVAIDSNTGEPVHHEMAVDYANVNGARVADAFTYEYPKHDCPVGQIPTGDEGACEAPEIETPAVELCF
jgi:hypothetical protein